MAIDPTIYRRSYDAGMESIMRPLREIEASRQAKRQQEFQDRQLALQDRLIAREDAALAREDEARQRRMTLGGLAAAGDYAGARRGALEAGDFELVNTLQSMEDGQRKQLAEVTRATAPRLMGLMRIAPELRRGALMQMAPELVALGLRPEQIEAVDLSDAGLERLGDNARTIEEFDRLQKEARDYGLRVAEFRHRQQHDAATLAATIRGQNISAANAARAAASSLSDVSGADRKTETDLRREFESRPEIKNFRDVVSSYRQIREARQQGTAAGDIQLIFSYMKMLDPGSVVREGEFATAQNAAGVSDRVRNAYNRALRGTRLTPEQRQEFVASAASVVNARRRDYDNLASQYRSYAVDYGVNPDRVARPLPPPPPPRGVSVGAGAAGARSTDPGADILKRYGL